LRIDADQEQTSRGECQAQGEETGKDFVIDFKISIPPHPEQQTIAAFLDRETAKIDALVAKKERLIELLQEKRTALISAAVTGKIDVREAVSDPGALDKTVCICEDVPTFLSSRWLPSVPPLCPFQSNENHP
jgi:hypothetical protein